LESDLPSGRWTAEVRVDLLGDEGTKRLSLKNVLTRRPATNTLILAERQSEFDSDFIDTPRFRHALRMPDQERVSERRSAAMARCCRAAGFGDYVTDSVKPRPLLFGTAVIVAFGLRTVTDGA
jgi:hypothetical protein